MSYHVLARRWRPQTFTEMVGQEHVLKALTNALSHDRLHHAYLFTGTRGVGKTTVARIFAKSLNCEEGVGPNPCGVCSACTEIAEGRFVDLIEVDAASRTKVEDTRELLENVQYSPSRGRFKVYIIDEVHMLSTSSFNALLKTLEEPPEHVKFLLATTDPQKLPVTVLSRCLQFNLKNMSPERIVNHLKYVLEQENVPFEEPALWLLAKSADGSMRDALSLTDQSIAFGNESVLEADVRNMLGTVDRAYVLHVLEALAKQDASMVLDEIARASDHAPDFGGILDELIAVLHRIGVAQMVPAAIDNSQGDQEYILNMAQSIQPHDVHLFYQIALASRKDMAAAADQRAALEMTLLRMLAFQIKRPGQNLAVPTVAMPNTTPVAPSSNVADSASPMNSSAQDQQPQASQQHTSQVTHEAQPIPMNESPAPMSQAQPESQPAAPVDEPPFDYDQPSPIQEAEGNVKKSQDEITNSPMGSAESVQIESVQPEPIQSEPIQTEPEQAQSMQAPSQQNGQATSEPSTLQATPSELVPEVSSGIDESALEDQNTPVDESSDWLLIESRMDLDRFTANLAANMVPVERNPDNWHFILTQDMETFLNNERKATLGQALSKVLGKELKVTVEPGVLQSESPAEYRIRKKAERLQLAINTFHEDNNVVFWKTSFGGQVLEDTIVPID